MSLTFGLLLLSLCACAAPQKSLVDSLPTYHGPRKILAVLKLENATPYGGEPLSRLASDMLTSALKRTDHFLLVERERLDPVLEEHALGRTGALDPSTQARVGQILGAQFLVMGTISEFGFQEGVAKIEEQRKKDREQEERGKGGKQEVKGSDTMRAASAASPDEIYTKRVDTRVILEVRAVEVKRGRVIWSEQVEGGEKGLSVPFRLGSDEAGGGILYDQATATRTLRWALDRCAYEMALMMEERPWEGRIARIGDHKIFVVGGRDAGVKVRSRAEIFR
ncbi:MAG: CsgG/HfaB family protein, partial [candidate division NC10 bacterium]|nr:CsgG/HfaB family protein [candidate division NC10 bacterium]